MTSSNNRRGGRLVLFDRMIINSFTPPGRSHTGYNFLGVDRPFLRDFLFGAIGRSNERQSNDYR
ncbi:hypothetical protein [Microcoleus sp. OTE_8_concoct_300]|uniref:hypothetical protein n=1 Tax=Microcoleus sp. OTE_8_concoct_300 TaxID=2964710 RepID=UPI00403FB331